MNIQTIRQNSLSMARHWGYPTNPLLPLLDPMFSLRPTDEIVDRILILYVLRLVSQRFSPIRGIKWLRREKLFDSLLSSELSLLKEERPWTLDDLIQLDSALSLNWGVSIINQLSWTDRYQENSGQENLLKLMPNIGIGKRSAKFRKRAKIRRKEEFYIVLDMAYVIHWGITHVNNHNLHRNDWGDLVPFGPVNFIEQRRALEWIASDMPWGEVNIGDMHSAVPNPRST